MGKSGKKSKSDKINALRKQYDAFLEEDKKRKDRNEYILGRMETMRSCTALVPVRSKAYPKIEDSDYSTQAKYKSTMAHISNSAITLSGPTHVTPKYTNKNYDEPSLLREISKKYFLIPKVTSNVIYNVNYDDKEKDPSLTDDTEWKSKYNILDELKRDEKEDQTNTIYVKPNKNSDELYKHNKNSVYFREESKEESTVQNKNTINLENTPSRPEIDMFPNKEPTYNNLLSPLTKNNDEMVGKTLNSDNIGATTELNMEKQELVPQSFKLHEGNLPASNLLPISQVENNIKQDSILISSHNIHEIKESNVLRDENPTPKIEPIEALENNEYLAEERKSIECNESQDDTAHYTLNNCSPIVTNENIIEEVNENNVVSVKDIDNHEYVRNENIVTEQGAYEVAGHLKDDPAVDNTEQQEYQQQESDLNVAQNIEHNVNSEVNDELETEQKEMFYSEDNDKTKEYNENADTTYSGENDNYINQEYSYYDESQKEQNYPTEINEHEESTERYDPNYEQQYANNYDDTMTAQYQPEQYNVENSYDQQQNMYEQQSDVNYQSENSNYEYASNEGPVKDSEPIQNVYYTNAQENAQYESQQLENTEIVDQSDTAYNASEDYEAQQEYITMHTEPPPIENVEQQLDVEDGYIPNTVGEENQDYQEHGTEETTPNQQTDIKVT